MHIVVCVKQIPNPEIAASQFRIDEAARRVVPLPGAALVMSPFDEQAVEAALRIRDGGAEVRLTALTLGPDGARAALKHALAMGADDGVLVDDTGIENGNAFAVARALRAAIRKLGDITLVLAGRQAADWDAGVVGCGIAELLEWPVITFARDVRVAGDVVRVERVVENGHDIVEAALPAVVTVSNELGKARAPSLRETMRASRKPVQHWKAADLEHAVSATDAARRRLDGLTLPPPGAPCEFIAAPTAEEQAAQLLRRLREAKVA